MSDLHFENHGSIITCTPQTEVGERWLTSEVQSEPWQWLGKSLCIDYRLANLVAAGAIYAGLEVD